MDVNTKWVTRKRLIPINATTVGIFVRMRLRFGGGIPVVLHFLRKVGCIEFQLSIVLNFDEWYLVDDVEMKRIEGNRTEGLSIENVRREVEWK